MDIKHTNCCIVGGGPAGMVLGLLLARKGVETLVLEKHADFFRDFRGDTIHPSTLEVMSELGILEQLLKSPHQITYQLRGYVEDQQITVADFSHLKVKCPYIAFMPQWDFLNFLAQEAKKYPNFKLAMQTDVVDLIQLDGKIIGVKAVTPSGELQIKADLVIGADGRHSTVRSKAGLAIKDIGAPMDVFWFRMPSAASDPQETFGKFSAGKIMIMINRRDYWQCGYVIPKGQAADLQKQDINLFRKIIADTLPVLANRMHNINTWDDVKLLSVQIDRLQTWYKPGLLCIGDAAHAMSPIGGVGINLAIQDAVATANILAQPLKDRHIDVKYLHAVQTRRELPTKIIQTIQVVVQNRIIKTVLQNKQKLKLPWIIRQFQQTKMFSRILGYIIGIGVRPEHVRNN